MRNPAMPPPTKRRKTNSAVAEVVFDSSAREDYLTGFHKRKQARIKHAQEIAVKREKAEKKREREELKIQRAREVEEHVKAVNASIRAMNGLDPESSGEDEEEEDDDGDDEVWQGLDNTGDANGQDEEYVDEDQYATVTVEAVDITRDGFVTPKDTAEDSDGPDDEKLSEPEKTANGTSTEKQKKGKRVWSKQRPDDGKAKRKKKRNFKYEGKDDRRANRAAQRSKGRAHAAARKAK